MPGFEFVYICVGHWDVYREGVCAFKIRGCPGAVAVTNESTGHRYVSKTILGAMMFLSELLVLEK
jgi:hypothetical protein